MFRRVYGGFVMEIVNQSEIKEKVHEHNITKEELEFLYLKEKMPMAEISRVYECDVTTIRRKLKKYKIPIRSHGAFLVDEDGKSLNLKRVKGEITQSEYLDKWAKKRGFKDDADRKRQDNYKRGIGTGLTMCENKDCSAYLGVYIAERILPLLFENVERMPDGNPGFDFICGNGYKIDVKSSSLHVYKKWEKWTFKIKQNKIADYFFMVAFNDREKLGVIHIWLIKGDSIIEKTTRDSEEFVFNEKYAVDIGHGKKSLERYKNYEIVDKLEEVQKICNIFRENRENREGCNN